MRRTSNRGSRGKIPKIVLEHEGINPTIRLLDDDIEFEVYFRRKIIEEAAELASAETNDHIIEEMADLEELLDTLIALKGLSRAQVATAQTEKSTKRGGFAKRILMLESANKSQKL